MVLEMVGISTFVQNMINRQVGIEGPEHVCKVLSQAARSSRSVRHDRQAGMLQSAVRLAVRLRTHGGACTDATVGHPEAWDPFWESWGRSARLPEAPGARSRAFCGAPEVRPTFPSSGCTRWW